MSKKSFLVALGAVFLGNGMVGICFILLSLSASPSENGAGVKPLGTLVVRNYDSAGSMESIHFYAHDRWGYRHAIFVGGADGHLEKVILLKADHESILRPGDREWDAWGKRYLVVRK